MNPIGRTYCTFYGTTYALYVYRATSMSSRPLVINFTHEEILEYKLTFRGAGLKGNPAPQHYMLTEHLEISLDMAAYLTSIVDWITKEVADKIGRMVRDYLLKEPNEEWGYIGHIEKFKGTAEYRNPITGEWIQLPFTVDTDDQKWEFTKEQAIEYVQNRRMLLNEQ